MKALFKSLPVLVLAGALSVSCGKGDNKSGSSSSPGAGGNTWDSVTQTQSYQSIDQVRSAFNQKAMNQGLSNGMEIYHMGSHFNSNYGGGGINFQAGFCIDLGFWSAGDCDSYGGPSQEDILIDQLNNGVYKKVTSSNASSVTYQQPTGVASDNYGGYVYTYNNAQNESFDRNSADYKEMLGLDIPANNLVDSKVSPATITLSNGQQVVGQVVELFIGSSYYGNTTVSDVRRYVLSANLPLAANPVAVISGIVNGYYGPMATVSGYLGFIGNTTSNQVQAVQSIKINQLHIHQSNYGGFQLTPVQNVTIGY